MGALLIVWPQALVLRNSSGKFQSAPTAQHCRLADRNRCACQSLARARHCFGALRLHSADIDLDLQHAALEMNSNDTKRFSSLQARVASCWLRNAEKRIIFSSRVGVAATEREKAASASFTQCNHANRVSLLHYYCANLLLTRRNRLARFLAKSAPGLRQVCIASEQA